LIIIRPSFNYQIIESSGVHSSADTQKGSVQTFSSNSVRLLKD